MNIDTIDPMPESLASSAASLQVGRDGGSRNMHPQRSLARMEMNIQDSADSAVVRVAVVQASPISFDTPSTLEKLADLTTEAAAGGARLVVFPEAFVGGYPKGYDFGVSLGVRTPEGRDTYRRYFESAIRIPGKETDFIGSVARARAVHLVVGAVERDGGTLYCTALIFGSDGTLLSRRRKLMPTALERVVWGMGDGSGIGVTPTSAGRIGAVICWENLMPSLRMALYQEGVELYCAITVDDRETWLSTIRHIAREGRCFVLSACQFLRRGELPAEREPAEDQGDSEKPLIRGGSCVVGPLGEILAGPVFDRECILTVDLDRNDLIRAKFDFDVVGHYARPDLFAMDRKSLHAASRSGCKPSPKPDDTSRFAMATLSLIEIPGSFAVCKLPAEAGVPDWAWRGAVVSVARTADELSIVCTEDAVPCEILCQRGWRCMRVAGSMPFETVGVLAGLTRPIAEAGIGVFAFSTFDTDYLLIRQGDYAAAIAALKADGHEVRGSG
jgi:nitrilase